jgi:dTDP-4-dehydrorhamnose 3,5-epimerase
MSDTTWHPTSIKGLWRCEIVVGTDSRGSGRRVTDVSGLGAHGVGCRVTDAFLLTTHAGVLRGMHAQRHGVKLITCLTGSVQEVVLDLRPDSATYGCREAFELTADSGLNLCIPAGVAHGFLTLGETDSVVLIQSDFSEGSAGGSGVRWDSFGHEWPGRVVVSERDQNLPRFPVTQV